MRRTFRLAAIAGSTALVGALCLPAIAGADGVGRADDGGPGRSTAPVYALTNDLTGNQVVTYLPSGRGALVQVGRTNTGGTGVALPGAAVDQLASQGGLASDPSDGLLVAVNGGSGTISVFHTFGAWVSAPRVVSSGGTTPVSVAVRGDVIYVLNAGGTGSIQGLYAHSLAPIPGSNHSLGLTPGQTPVFLNTPGQIGFTPDGRHLVVTTKANGSEIDVFPLTWWGGVAGPPTVNPSATPVPFGFTFDRAGDLVVTEAGTSALTTYSLATDGALTELGSTTDGLHALCWVASNGTYQFGSNAGSGAITSYSIGATGTPTVVATTVTDPGPVDLATSPDGRSLYVETGGSDLLDAFTIQANGSLVPTGSVAPELPGHTGLEGIAVGGSF